MPFGRPWIFQLFLWTESQIIQPDMKKSFLSLAAMMLIGTGAVLAQSAETSTDAAPATEMKCSKGKKKACCAAKMQDGADASATKTDGSGSSAMNATEPKKAEVLEAKSVAEPLPTK
jgi:hypothetical protein